MKKYDTIIIGAGPAGMSAALTLSKNSQTVLLLDRGDRIGKKILVTGNGKCNLTNTNQTPACYRGDAPEYAGSIFSCFGVEETFAMLRSLGIHTRDRNGYIYPYNEQASCVREAFEEKIISSKEITVLPQSDVSFVHHQGSDFIVGFYNKEKKDNKEIRVRSHTVILATGGLAGEKLGCDGTGYRIAKELGHRVISPAPALTALKSKAPFLKKLSGVRNQAAVSLYIEDTLITKEIGELQWTNYGISGVAVFQLSRYAVRALEQRKNTMLQLDFLPDLSKEDAKELLLTMIHNNKNKTAIHLLNGIFPAKLCPVLLREVAIEETVTSGSMKQGEVEKLLFAIKEFRLRISGYMGFEKAQVTCGGIATSELNEKLESKLVPGLFFAGEIVDIDGTCGGYNLQWAFSSGNVAGQAAYERNKG